MKGVLIPQEVFVGDHAQFLIQLKSVTISHDVFFEIDGEYHAILDDYVQASDITIEKIIIKKNADSFSVHLYFIPWKIGKLSFPSLKKFGISSTLPTITIQSVVKKTGVSDLSPAHSPLLLPGTISFIAKSVGFVFCGLIVIVLLIRKIKKTRAMSYLKKNHRKNRRIFLRTLKKLLRKYKTLESDEWCTIFDSVLRLYLNDFFIEDDCRGLALNLTYTEMYQKLPMLLSEKQELLYQFKMITDKIQCVRFSKNSVLREEEKNEIISFAHTLFDACEQWFLLQMKEAV